MNKKINVLVFPAGEVNSVELHNALSTNVNINLYGGSSQDRHGPYVFQNYIPGIPYISDPSFLEALNQILDTYDIDVIFPTHDTVATFFTSNREKIRATVIAADKKTAEICRDKYKTYKFFAGCDFVPKLFEDLNDLELPVFAKPKIGQGSIGAKKVTTQKELKEIDLVNYIACEYLPGDEYTVDCLTDKNGKLRLTSPRSRNRLMAGISVSGSNLPVTKEIQSIAMEINDKLSFSGLWFFQVKQDKKGKLKLLEVSTRCAGSMCLTRALGANLPLLSVYVAQGYDIDVLVNSYNITMDRTLINRYKIDYEYENVYLDFDDTVVINGKVHLSTMMFIYQCRNLGKKIYLITKHAYNIDETLAQFSINRTLFQDIIHLEPDDHKLLKINPYKSIFIDNAYHERKLVHDKYAIPVFDVDMLEVLLDWRI